MPNWGTGDRHKKRYPKTYQNITLSRVRNPPQSIYSFFAIEGNCSWIVVLPRDCTTTTEAGFEPDVNEKFEIDHRDKHNLHECTIHNQGRESICLTCSRIRTTLSNYGLWPTVMNIINNLTVTVNPTITALLPLRSWQLQSSESRHNHLILLESEHTTGRRI